MTTTAIVMSVLVVMLAVSLVVNYRLFAMLHSIDCDLAEDGPRFGWTLQEYEEELVKLERENKELSEICDKQQTTIDFLMGRM